MEEVKSNAGQNLGIAALITAIITFVLAVIPCIGLMAWIPGIIAVILAAIGLSQASRSNTPRGLMIAGLIIAVIATMISVSQVFIAGKLARGIDKWPHEFRSIIDEVQDNVIKELEDKNVNIKIESNGEVVEINTRSKDKEKLLEGLEKADTLENDTSKTGK